MNVLAVFPFLLIFLIHSIGTVSFPSATEESRQFIGEDDTDDEEPEPVVTPHPCHCSHLTFGADEMEGNIKSPGYPGEYCNDQKCSFEVESHPTKATILIVESMEMEWQYDRLRLFFLSVTDGQKERIYLENLALASRSASNRFVAPPRIGFFLNMTADHSQTGRFLLRFNRIEAKTEDACPYPFIEVNSTIGSLKLKAWGTMGCGVRLSSNYSIQIIGKCSQPWHSDRMSVQATLPGEIEEYWSFVTGSDREERKTSSTADIVVRGTNDWKVRKSLDSCELSFYSIDYDPCNCSTTEFELSVGQELNISSPGYPNMFCRNIHCEYIFRRASLSPSLKNAFVLRTDHTGYSYDDSLKAYAVKEGQLLQLWRLGKDQRNNQPREDVIVADGLKIEYKASSSFQKLHGFTLVIGALDTPNDCLCPSNFEKDLPISGTYSYTVLSHCPQMHCRFRIPVISYVKTARLLLTSLKKLQNFRMSLSYIFQGENEQLEVETDNVLRSYSAEVAGRATMRKFNAAANDVHVRYRRQTAERNETLAEGPSVFNLTWKWLNRNDCSCERNIFKADAEHWDEIYSPRYPLEDYCINMDCVYLVQAPIGYHVLMNVTFFQTEPHSDYLFFFDSFNTSGVHVQQLSGHALTVPPFESSTRNASIRFKTDGSITEKGFVIAFKAIKDEEQEPEKGEGHGLLILGLLVVLAALLGVAGFLVYNRKNISFRNPVYVPTVRYSNAGEDGHIEIGR